MTKNRMLILFFLAILEFICNSCNNKPPSNKPYSTEDYVKIADTIIPDITNDSSFTLEKVRFETLQQLCNADVDRYVRIEDPITKKWINKNIKSVDCRSFLPMKKYPYILFAEFFAVADGDVYYCLMTCDTIGNIIDTLLIDRTFVKEDDEFLEKYNLAYYHEDSISVTCYNYDKKKSEPGYKKERLWVVTATGVFEEGVLPNKYK